MKRTSLLLIPAITAAILTAQKTPEAALGAALHQEEVQGDLNGAIAAFQKLVESRGVSHKIAAEALYHLGLCYQKLGDAKARHAFERLVNEYGDTPWASRVKIMDLRATQRGRQTVTLVWSGKDVDDEGSVSPDGRYISYPDWSTGNLALHDVITGADRAVTTAGTWKHGEAAFAEESVFSRDGKQIAYGWYESKSNRFDLRVANLTGDPNPRKIFESPDMHFLAPGDWSPDGKWIAINLEPENSDARTGLPARPGMKAAIALVGVQDRSLRVLKDLDWSGPRRGSWKILFSRDGKFLAYDRESAGSREQKRGVFVMDLATYQEFPVATGTGNDQLVGWSPWGKQILFTSNRTGAVGLWAAAFSGGAVLGQPELIKSDLGSADVVGMTAAGALYYFLGRSWDLPQIQMAGFDLNTGKLTSQPTSLPGPDSGEGSSSPAWSPDGKSLAYLAQKPAGSKDEYSIKIHSIESGESRELYPGLAKPTNLRWAADRKSLLWSDANGLYRVEIQSREVSMLATRPKDASYPVLSADGKTLYQKVQHEAESAFVAIDLASGERREVIRRAYLGGMNLSPDERHIATPTIDPADHSWAFIIIPVSGGAPRDAIRIKGESEAETLAAFRLGALTSLAWAPDSKSILIRKRIGVTHDYELWQGLVDGGEARRINGKLEPSLTRSGGQIAPGGQRIVFQQPSMSSTQRAPAQIMVLENFLPNAN